MVGEEGDAAVGGEPGEPDAAVVELARGERVLDGRGAAGVGGGGAGEREADGGRRAGEPARDGGDAGERFGDRGVAAIAGAVAIEVDVVGDGGGERGGVVGLVERVDEALE